MLCVDGTNVINNWRYTTGWFRLKKKKYYGLVWTWWLWLEWNSAGTESHVIRRTGTNILDVRTVCISNLLWPWKDWNFSKTFKKQEYFTTAYSAALLPQPIFADGNSRLVNAHFLFVELQMNVSWLPQKQDWSLQFNVLRSRVFVFQAELLLVPLLVLAKRWLQNWKLMKYKIVNSSGKVSNFNFILKTNFFTSKFVLIFY